MKRMRRDEYGPDDLKRVLQQHYGLDDSVEIELVYDTIERAVTARLCVKEFQILDILAERVGTPRQHFEMGPGPQGVLAVCEWSEETGSPEAVDEEPERSDHWTLEAVRGRPHKVGTFFTNAVELTTGRLVDGVVLDSWWGAPGQWVFFVQLLGEYNKTPGGPPVNPAAQYTKVVCTADTEVRTDGRRSRLPGWHPKHQCGFFCDGQDGMSSTCYRERNGGRPWAWCTRKNQAFGIGDVVAAVKNRFQEDRPHGQIVAFDEDKSMTMLAVVQGYGKMYVTDIELY